MLAPLQPRQAGSTTTPEYIDSLVAYLELLVARQNAVGLQVHPHANPVSLPRFRSRGIGELMLRWMLHEMHVEHLQPGRTSRGSPPRWDLVCSLDFRESSAFALTDKGEVFAERLLSRVPLGDSGAIQAIRDGLFLGPLVPRYDKENRLFLWGGHVLKRFRQQSGNQELILAAAQELGWPEWFDDPLPRQPGQNPKVRLHDAIKNLNRRQVPYLIHFKGDGTGTRVGWEYL